MDKAEITKTLTDSYEFITTHILEIPSSQFGDAVTFPFPGEYDKLFAIMLGVDHCAEHLGQLIAYARVNGVAPGAVMWPSDGKPYTNQQEMLARTPLQRVGAPEDVAGAVLWLLRDAPFVTGQTIRVDGGRTLSV